MRFWLLDKFKRKWLLKNVHPVAAHSMLYSLTPFAFKEQMFKFAKGMKATQIRCDVDVTAIFTSSSDPPDWTTLDHYILLSAKYKLPVLAVIQAMPFWLANCASSNDPLSYKCGTDDPVAFAALVSQIVEHAKGWIHDWELLNEPDGVWSYTGTPEQYGGMLVATHKAIHGADPGSRLAIGGIMNSKQWVSRVLEVPNARASVDIANVHLRPLANIRSAAANWKVFFEQSGVHGPLWVTEHGYPSDQRYQEAAGYKGHDVQSGLSQQARYLKNSVPELVAGGASKVFVTLRDNMTGKFASEGVLSGQVADPIADQPVYEIHEKPSYQALMTL